MEKRILSGLNIKIGKIKDVMFILLVLYIQPSLFRDHQTVVIMSHYGYYLMVPGRLTSNR